MEIPYFIAQFDEENCEHGLRYVSIVDTPAILTQYVAFSKKPQELLFTANTARQIIAGPVLVPNLPIKRKDDNMGEYYVVFTKEVITQVMEHYFKRGGANNVNLMHLPNSKVSDVAMVECFQIDSKRGIKPPKGFEHLVDGTFWAGYKFFDKKTFDVMKDNYRGFSIEGFLDMVYGGTIDNKDADDIIKELTQIENFLKK